MKTFTVNNSTLSKSSFFLALFLILITNALFAQLDSLDCNVESVVYECQGFYESQAAAEAWHQANIDRLRANCIGQDSGKIIKTYFFDLDNLSSPPNCNPCYIHVTYTLIDTIEKKIIFDKVASFKIVDTSPPIFLNVERFDTIECKYTNPIISWNEGKATQIRSKSSDCSIVTFPFGSYQEEIPSQNEKLSSARYLYEFSDIYGNSDTISIILTILDTIPPKISCDPINLTIESSSLVENEQQANLWNDENLKVLDNCSQEFCSDVFVTSNFDFTNLTNSCGNKDSLVVNYAITDEYNNTATRTATLQFTKSDLENSCNCIEINSIDNNLTLSNLSAPNTVVKVFDPNWQIIYNCSGDCPEIVTIPDLIAGEPYHTDVQFYDENWAFVCEDKRDIVIEGGGEPCDTSICAGDVILRTQAEVDAFCGCTVIEGDLMIGLENGNTNGIPKDIFTLENLNSVRRIGGQFIVAESQINDYSGLESLYYIGDGFVAINNFELKSFKGLENLIYIGNNLGIYNNNKLTDVSNFEKLSTIGTQLYINGNTEITKISGFNSLVSLGNNIELTSDKILNLSSNDKLKFITGFENLKQIPEVFINSNPSLTSIQLLQNVKQFEDINITNNQILTEVLLNLDSITITNNLIVEVNPLLENCCLFSNLFDDNLENGQILGRVIFSRNKSTCNSPEEILQNCQTPPPTCENIQIITQNNQITIDGLTASNEIVKVFDKDYNIIYQCVANCEERQIAGIFPEGNYTVDLQLYDENWGFICAEHRSIVLETNDEPCDTIVCKGNITLRTQAEVDAFCGCEVIEGDLKIGNLETTIISDISNLATLSSIKKVLGNVAINRTILKNISGLDNLEETSILSIRNCNDLMNLNALEKLKIINFTFDLGNNASLNDITGIRNLRKVQNILLSGCPISDLTVFANLENTTLGNIDITNSQQLLNLDGFQNIIRLENELGSGGITLGGNKALTDISALANLTYAQKITIADNDALDNCCTIAHLLDEDEANGILIGQPAIFRNGNFCNSPEAILQNCQIQPSTCEDIQILTENNQIIIDGLTVPNEIVKVFDKDYNILFECNSNCDERQIVGDFEAGNYIIDIQLYDESWEQICFEQRTITLETPSNNNCENIQISSDAGQILLSNTAAPNSIVKVFDPNWQLIYDCTATCENEIVVPVESEGIYHSDIQFYDEDWKFICADKQDIEVISIGEPCNTSICAGNVVLNTQAEVDAFCECEVIEGNLTIGQVFSTDIKSLDNLNTIKLIKGNLVISTLGIKDLDDFVNLEKIEGRLIISNNPILEIISGFNNLVEVGDLFQFSRNDSLRNLKGLEKLQIVKRFVIAQNSSLAHLNDLANLRVIDGIFLDYSYLSDISVFGQLENKVLNELVILGNRNLESLKGLEQIDSIMGILSLSRNEILTDIVALQNIKFAENFSISLNESLTNCCSIVHLIDDNPDNGYSPNPIAIQDNAQFCNSIESLIEYCALQTCENIEISTENNQIVLNDLRVPNEIIKVYDKDYNILFECNANCEETQAIGTFPDGQYYLDLQLYDENWILICAEQRSIILGNTDPCLGEDCENIPPVLTNIPIDITISDTSAIPTDFPLATDNCDTDVEIFVEDSLTNINNTIIRTFTAVDDCDNFATAQQYITIGNPCTQINVSSSTEEVRVKNIITPNNVVTIFNENYQVAYECINCDEEIVAPVQFPGIYHVKIQSFNENGAIICEYIEDIEVCESIACQGNIQIFGQEAMDAFCGCEEIDGSLLISNVVDIANLKQLKRISGSLTIRRSSITSLLPLNNLEEVGGKLDIKENFELTSLDGLDNLKKTKGGLRLDKNTLLTDIEALANLDSTRGVLMIGIPITNLDVFENLHGNKLDHLAFFSCGNLVSIDGISKIDTILGEVQNVNSLSFSNCISLVNIEPLRNIKYVGGGVNFSGNESLNECCSIRHLIDRNPDNGRVVGGVHLSGNPIFCNAPAIINKDCHPLLELCENASISVKNNQIEVSGLSAPRNNIIIWGEQFRFECSFSTCEETEITPELNYGEYFVLIRMYDEYGDIFCDRRDTIEILDSSQTRNSDLLPTDFALYPNPAKAATFIDLSKIKGEPVTLNLYNQFGQQVWTKRIEQIQHNQERVDLSNFQNGLYFLKIQTNSRKLVAKKLMISRLY